MPILLQFRGNTVRRLIGTVDGLTALPRVRIETPIDLFLAHENDDFESEEEDEFMSAHNGEFGDQTDSQDLRIRHPLISRITVVVRLILEWLIAIGIISLAISALLIYGSHPVFLPLPLHLPILDLTTALNPAPAVIPSIVNDLRSFSVLLAPPCSKPGIWAGAFHDGVPEAGELSDHELYSTEEDEYWRLEGASKEDMRRVANLCQDLSRRISGVISELQSTCGTRLQDIVSSVHLLLSTMSQGLTRLRRDISRSPEPSMSIYYQALNQQHKFTRIIERHVPDVLDDDSDRGAYHTRRNPNAWKAVSEKVQLSQNILEAVEDFLKLLQPTAREIREIQKQTGLLQQELERFENSGSELLTIPIFGNIQALLDLYTHGVSTQLHRANSLYTIIPYIAWSQDLPTIPYPEDPHNYDLWTSLWIVSGALDGQDMMDHDEDWSWKQKSVRRALGLLGFKSEVKVMIPRLDAQVEALERARANIQSSGSVFWV